MSVRIIEGDCRELLRTLPDESVHCVVTSPPYYGLRDYGVAGQMGLEGTPEQFIAGMVEVFREVRRVLRDDGTLWLNMGDSYAGSGRGGNPTAASSTLEGSQATQEASMIKRTRNDVSDAQCDHCPTVRVSRLPAGLHESQRQAGAIGRAWVPPPSGFKQKDLMGIPWMLAFALRADGWYLRQDIIWAKPNPMPESVRDRCTKAHEYLFLLSKSPRYYFDADAIAEPLAESSVERLSQPTLEQQAGSNRVPGKTNGAMKAVGGKGNRKTFRGGGMYTNNGSFDNDAEPCNDSIGNEPNTRGLRNKRSVWNIATQPFKEAHFATFPPDLVEPCVIAGCPRDGMVLDPFGGAGTTGLVADRLQRNAILIELNPEYAAIARRRIHGDAPLLAEVIA